MCDSGSVVSKRCYRVLGSVAAYRAGRPLPLHAPKQLTVLAALLLAANRVVAEERLLTMLWGERMPRSARGRLQVYVSELRAALGRDVISRSGGGYLIHVLPDELDLQVFDDAVSAARSDVCADRADVAAQRLRSALQLWTGPPLGGVGHMLAERERPALEERRLAAMEVLFDAELLARRHAQVVGELRQALAENPFREKLAGQLMLALHRAGRQAEALEVYREAHRALVDELGIEPGHELQAMHARILNGEEYAPATFDATSLPAHRATSPVAQRRPAELPRDTHGFSGRAEALTTLHDQLTPPHGAITIITGPPGVGKSALAVHWAHQARDHFPDGQLYLNLNGHAPDQQPMAPAIALAHLLGSLGTLVPGSPNSLDEQMKLYRSALADRRLLLLLDNARDAAQVLPLLPPSGSVVITSRHRLSELIAHPGAHVVSLPPLSTGSSYELLCRMLGRNRVAAESDSAIKLIEICSGLPLALRIVAANLSTEPSKPIASTANELTSGDVLTDLTLDGTESSAVVAAFSASYRALNSAERRLFRLLGLVLGPNFTAATAAAIAGTPVAETKRLLQGLVAAHLVEAPTTSRYRFHDLIRLYAAAQARTDPDRTTAWARLIDHYIALVSSSNATDAQPRPDTLRPPSHQFTRHDHPRPELSEPTVMAPDIDIINAAAAAPRAALHGPYPAAWLLAVHLRDFFQRHERPTEWLSIAPVILDAAKKHENREIQALLHYSIGESRIRIAQHRDSIHHLHDAIRIAHEIGWRECEAAALAELASSLQWVGRINDAIRNTEKAANLFSDLGSASGEARMLDLLSRQLSYVGEPHLAERSHRRALDLTQRHGLHPMRATILAGLGAGLLSLGRLAEAEDTLNRAHKLSSEVQSNACLAWCHVWLARVAQENFAHERAFQESRRAVDIAHDAGTTLIEAIALAELADAEISLAQYSAAEGHAFLAIDLVNENHFSWHQANVSLVLARLHTELGNHSTAADYAQRVGTHARESGHRPLELKTLITLAEIYKRWGKRELAESASRDAMALSLKTGIVTGIPRLYRMLTQERHGHLHDFACAALSNNPSVTLPRSSKPQSDDLANARQPYRLTPSDAEGHQSER